MRLLLLTGLLLLQIAGLAQYKGAGQVVVIQDPLVDSVLHQYEALRAEIMENPDNKAIPGFRIQIFFDSGLNSSDRAKQAQAEFQEEYPDIQTYVSWKAPNYRVRVGDFKSRLEAEKVLQMIIADYPNAWVIKDEINFPQMN